MPKGRNSRPFLMPRYFDLATDTEIDLDADTDDVEYLGDQKRRGSLEEWYGAQYKGNVSAWTNSTVTNHLNLSIG